MLRLVKPRSMEQPAIWHLSLKKQHCHYHVIPGWLLIICQVGGVLHMSGCMCVLTLASSPFVATLRHSYRELWSYVRSTINSVWLSWKREMIDTTPLTAIGINILLRKNLRVLVYLLKNQYNQDYGQMAWVKILTLSLGIHEILDKSLNFLCFSFMKFCFMD